MPKIISIMSGKGGTGKSTFAVNIGLSLTAEGKRVLLVDLATGFRSLDLYLGVQDRAIFDIADVIEGRADIERAVVPFDNSGMLWLLPGCQDRAYSGITEESLNEIIRFSEGIANIIIFDCPTGITREVEAAAKVSDVTVMVSSSDYVSLRDSDVLEDYLIRARAKGRCYLLNRVDPALIEKGVESAIEDIDRRFKCGALGLILEDPNIRASTGAGTPIVAKDDTYIAGNFAKIAKRLY
jgi:septum site-determining protein MinD